MHPCACVLRVVTIGGLATFVETTEESISLVQFITNAWAHLGVSLKVTSLPDPRFSSFPSRTAVALLFFDHYLEWHDRTCVISAPASIPHSHIRVGLSGTTLRMVGIEQLSPFLSLGLPNAIIYHNRARMFESIASRSLLGHVISSSRDPFGLLYLQTKTSYA